VYIPANCDRIQKVMKELTEHDYRAPKVENTQVGPQLFDKFMEEFEMVESMRKTQSALVSTTVPLDDFDQF